MRFGPAELGQLGAAVRGQTGVDARVGHAVQVDRLESMAGRQRRLRAQLDRPVYEMYGTRARR
jgi:hypothetical protein